MAVAGRAQASASGFSSWAIGPWVVLLLAGMGMVQYLRHGDYLYLGAALVVVVVSASCIMRQAWARPAMQWLALLLALWALLSGAWMLRQWGDFEIARQHALAQPQLAPVALWLIARAQRTWTVALALKAAAIPLLSWLAWGLGRADVRAQFRSWRGAAAAKRSKQGIS
ncbi:MAG: hypothetical protein KGM46_10535 [Pseudomonadota bacterium]|nr:hypothetical protein [Xanthomonadaceae bacterium]MDE2248732.1 hypothetical protein [Xanthomonadaceae bacterium]MDE3211169.1 hypothetical protein [Pseudomonadota bacterium]